MPDRRSKQKGGRVFVFAITSCGNGDELPIRGAKVGNGWDFEIDANQNGTFAMKVRFDFSVSSGSDASRLTPDLRQ
jgi:hypothetical protein